MEALEWNANYATGIPEIDAQHSYLFELTNRLIRGILSKDEMPALQTILSELLAYARRHFSYEEHLMHQAGYAHLEEHRQSHERLTDRIMHYNSELQASRLEPRDLAEFLCGWLKIHVLRDDMDYIPALTANGGKMKMPEWRPEYSVGVPEIDAQHQHLFALGATLAESVRSTTGQTNLKAILAELVCYANEHFAFEEIIMEKINYEHLMYHQKMHDFMRTRINLLSAQLDQGLLTENELAEFMETWLTEHIIMEDMRYITAIAADEIDRGYV